MGRKTEKNPEKFFRAGFWKRMRIGRKIRFLMDSIPANICAARSRIVAACAAVGRPADSTRLVAVAKTFPAEAVRTAFAAGCRAIGENYLQEAREKMLALSDLAVEWHFVGSAQSNKAGAIARCFEWAHGLDSVRAAEKMSAARGEAGMNPMNVFLQVNISREAAKSGVAPEDALGVAREIAVLPHLNLRGLTAIPAPDLKTRRLAFRRVAELRVEIAAELSSDLPDLSMGMSADLEEAIAEGATFVRIGEAIFGKRERKEKAR